METWVWVNKIIFTQSESLYLRIKKTMNGNYKRSNSVWFDFIDLHFLLMKDKDLIILARTGVRDESVNEWINVGVHLWLTVFYRFPKLISHRRAADCPNRFACDVKRSKHDYHNGNTHPVGWLCWPPMSDWPNWNRVESSRPSTMSNVNSMPPDLIRDLDYSYWTFLMILFFTQRT